MAFVFEGIDKPGSLELRLANRAAHLAHVEAQGDTVIAGGPLLGDDGKPVGSLLILDFATRAEMEAFAAADPYAKAGLFQATSIRPWVKVFPKA